MHCPRAPFLLIAAVIVGCSDAGGPTPTSPTDVDAPYAEIDAQIARLYPDAQQADVVGRWHAVTFSLSSGDQVAAEKMFWDLVESMLHEPGSVGEQSVATTRLQPLSRLVGDMYAVVFPSLSRPPTLLDADAAIGLVLPRKAATIVTATHHAGVAFPAGSVALPTLVVIFRNPTSFDTHCGGPLTTTLCQYPFFYRFEEFPHFRLRNAARFGVCPAADGDLAPPEAIRERLRLAHDAPATPSPGATLVEGIEILPPVDVSDFLTCEDPANAASSASPGGASLEFSNFNLVDPLRPVGIDFETFPGGASTSPTCDAPCDLSSQYASAGVTFDFVPTGGQAVGHASLLRNSFDPAGTLTHQVAHAFSVNAAGGFQFFDGTIVARFSNATTVSFLLRTVDGAPTVPINAFGPPPAAAPIPATQITRTNAITFSACATCTVFRQETITVTNSSGISRIEIAGGTVHVFLDDMTIVAPPTPPIV